MFACPQADKLVAPLFNIKPAYIPKRMKTRFTSLHFLAVTCAGWMFTAFPNDLFGQSPEAAEQEPIVLSPFVLDEDNSEGYRATNTLAGTRLRTPLRDLGSAIEVVTKEFLEDTGATNAGELLSYTLNTETGGMQGNFAGGGFDSGGNRTDQNEARINPQFNQRVRGLGAASLTRDYFLTNIPFDSYNSSQVTINRGPNSILFGVGSPGGIIDNSLNKASFVGNFGTAVVRIGSHGSYRGSLDYNHILIDDRVSFRVAGLLEKNNYNQDPAYEQDQRLYASVEAVLLKNDNSRFLDRTVLRANIENGNIESNPPMVVPPRSLYHNWWTAPTLDYAQYTGSTPPANHTTNFVPQYTSSLDKTPGGISTATTPNLAWTTVFDQGALVFQDPNAQAPDAATPSFPGSEGLQGRMTFYPGAQRYEWFSTQAAEGQNYATGFVYPSIQDRNVFDYHNQLFSGNTSIVDREFTTYNVALEQLFFDDKSAGIELAYDNQKWKPFWQTPVDDSLVSIYSNADITIDISEKLANGDPNPNLGRPYVRLFDFGGYREQQIDREAARATAFYEFDFEKVFENGWGKWLGSHTFNGLLSTQKDTNEFRNYRASWTSDEIQMPPEGWSGRNGSFFRTVLGVAYVGPSALNATGPEQVRISPINVPVPQLGDVYNIWYQGRTGNASNDDSIKANNFNVSHVLFGGNMRRNEIDSKAFTVQSRLLDGHLVGLVGWRTDEASSYERLTTQQIAELTGDTSRYLPDGNLKPENFILQSEPSAVESGDTFTASVVAHVPDEWTSALPLEPRVSFHYGTSENFSPVGLRRDVYLNVIAPPTGETKEYGFSLELARKFHVRVNWFETESAGFDAGLNAALLNNRTAYQLERMVAEPQNTGWTFEETKAAATVDLGGADPIPNINSYAEMEAAIRGLVPSEIMDQLNYRVTQDNAGNYQVENETFGGQVATAVIQAKGFEIDFVANPTPSWRIMLNVGKQETVQSDSAPVMKQLADTIVANMEASGLANLRVSPTFNAPETVYNNLNRLVLVPLNGVLAKDGTTSLEQRKWRANLVTNYRFGNGSPLKGFAVGGGLRWQDEVGIGYSQIYTDETGIIPDLSQPYFAPSEWNADLWLSYEKRLSDAINWRIQLNLRNALGDNDDIPVRANPDGTIAAIRIPNEKTWFLTNTFEF